MAKTEDDQRVRASENEPDLSNTDSSSDDDDDDDDDGLAEVGVSVEWLATGREKRSTAGNRMKSMLAAEEPDDDLELLFAEDEDDAGFTDVDDGGSDVQMDSSSDDEDAQENADELEGEKELEKRARESRQAARKRKAQEAIPIKFRKKVKIAPTPSGGSTAPESKPRPKKKSERTSWLPSPADMPTRASKRETTMLSKEQLHQQMIKREVKRLKQVEAMEKKAKKMEAMKKPPMTQAERLAEAAIVEKKNAKSLNRWEEAEKQREEERRAKLAALNNRTLDGPVVTFWSGVGEWVDGKLKHVGKIVTIEEKPVKKKRVSAVGHDTTAESSKKGDPGPEELAKSGPKEAEPKDQVTSTSVDSKTPIEGENTTPAITGTGTSGQPAQPTVTEMPTSAPKESAPPAPAAAPIPSNSLSQPQPLAQDLKLPETKPLEVHPPDIRPPISGMYTTSMFAPPQSSPLMKPPELKPPSNSFLAPPAGISQGGLSMPMIGYHPSPNTGTPSTVLAPPNTAQRQSPLSMPQTGACPPPVSTPSHSIQPPSQPVSTAVSANAPTFTSIATPAPTPAPAPAPTLTTAPTPAPGRKKYTSKLGQTSTPNIRYVPKHRVGSTTKTSKANAPKHKLKETSPPPPPPPPANGKATRNCIILQNFNEDAVQEKAVQNRILFNKDMAKLGKVAPAPRCVITNHPARYKDPKTGLPYYNAYAFREIRRLWHGEYKWSSLLGAWVGSGSLAASGVPARFLNPDAPGPPKKSDPSDGSKEHGTESNTDSAPTAPAVPGEQTEQVGTTDVQSPTVGGTSKSPQISVPTPALAPLV
ncbi:YL1-domain-containing protein [Hypoxylon sp. NC1633]|nr:YL1-domain-containing protein [Hypoxylon sp. NC1633]